MYVRKVLLDIGIILSVCIVLFFFLLVIIKFGNMLNIIGMNIRFRRVRRE